MIYLFFPTKTHGVIYNPDLLLEILHVHTYIGCDYPVVPIKRTKICHPDAVKFPR